jgi:hypothetical protein
MRFGCIFSSFLAILLASCQLQAQAPSQSSSASSSVKHVKKPASAIDSPLDAGSASYGVYRNTALGFSCKIPAGWVLRTDEMNARQGEDEKSAAGKTPADAGQVGRVLLAAFSRPPEARAEDVNASILIAAESVAAYPGLKDAAQYFGPLTEVAKSQGFKIVNEPYEFLVGTKMVVRGDFQKDVGARVMRQSSLAILAHGYAISFTFIGGTEDEVEELVEGMSFAASVGTNK